MADQKLSSLAILSTHKHKDVDIDGLLPARTPANVIKPSRFCYYVQKGHGVRENLVSVIVSTFLIFMFVDQLLLVDVFSQLYYLTYAKKQQCRTYRYKSLKSWKIDTIDLTQQFSLPIFTIETKITDSHSRVSGPFWVNKGVSFFKNTRKNFKPNVVLVHIVVSGRLETTGSAVS